MFRPLMAALAAAPVLMGCTLFAQAQDFGTRSPGEQMLIAATCTKVMGLEKGQEFYLDCQDSLAHTLAMRDAAYAMAAGGKACREQGLAPGSSALATCMLDRQGGAGRAPMLEPVSVTTGTIQPGRSYYSVSAEVQMTRQRYACAQLGLMPNSDLFQTCVASLQGELQPYSG